MGDHRIFSLDSRRAAWNVAAVLDANVIELVIAIVAVTSELSVAYRTSVLLHVHVNPVR
jgi:hypothetical protein